jgi:hypothetical protein
MRVALVASALVLTGCGLADNPGSRTPSAPPEPAFVEPVCPPGATPGLVEPATGTAVPEDFQVAWVLHCPGAGADGQMVTERADTAATELLAELRRPSDPLTNGVCPTILIIPPYVLLVDGAGRAVHPYFPTDACGQPREAARNEVQELDFRVVERAPVTR